MKITVCCFSISLTMIWATFGIGWLLSRKKNWATFRADWLLLGKEIWQHCANLSTCRAIIDYYNMDWKLMTSHFYLLAITRYRVRVFFPNLEHLSIEFFDIFWYFFLDNNRL